MDNIGEYKELVFSKTRELYIDGFEQALKKHHIKALIELDITSARKAIRKYRARTGKKLSFIAWLTKCISQAVSEHNQVHGIRKGKKIIVFNDIDILMVIEKELNGQKMPLPYIIRESNNKTFQDINDEIEIARKPDTSNINMILGNDTASRKIRFYLSLPGFIRKLIVKKILRSPFSAKKWMGTVTITTVGMFLRSSGFVFPLPFDVHPLCFALGNIVKKPAAIKGNIEIREYLNMTIFIDHDIVDGAPAARFISKLARLAESAYGLDTESP